MRLAEGGESLQYILHALTPRSLEGAGDASGVGVRVGG
jgi:hypothetical protein